MSVLPRRLTSRFDAWGRRLADESSERVAAQVSAAVERTVRDEMRELARMLSQQGDAAEELAETFGRILLRLSSSVDELQARLDRLESAEERPARS
jgi:hypothetical protein